MYHWLVPRVVFPLAERLSGNRAWSELCRLRDLQWDGRDELEARTSGRLRALLVHAAEQVPHYRDLFARVGLRPTDLRASSDLARLPITTKADLRAGFPERTTAKNLPPNRRQAMKTSGSTGLPFEFYWDRATSDIRLGAYLFSLEWAGVALWDTRIAVLIPSSFGTNTIPASRPRQLMRRIVLGEHNLRLPADSLTVPALRSLIARVPRGRRYFLRGYPSAIAWLARLLSEEGVPLAAYPAAVITYAETLTAMNARIIEEAFRCRAVNCYTSWDIPQMAQGCPDNPAVLHVNSDRIILRIVRSDGRDAAPGERGKVVVTDLANDVMPFINYAIGDDAVAGHPCPCGRGFPTLASLEGRDAEVIATPDGRRVSGVVLGHFLAFVAGVIPYVFEYQAIQTAPDAVTLRVVPTSRFTPELAAALRRDLERFLGAGVGVAVELVDRIPLESSGKRLIIKSQVRQPELKVAPSASGD
jgi:phenylacetate-CoA ligase